MRRADRVAWANYVMSQLFEVFPPSAHVVMLAGQNYRRDLVPALQSRGFTVSIPFDGLPLGQQLSRLKLLAARGYRDD